jgi:hypothetical protein
MKKINLIIVVAITISALAGCSKQASGPSDTYADDSTQQLIEPVSSDWFSAGWLQNGDVKEYVKPVLQSESDILKDGKVLVFGKGGFEMRNPTALPSSFDANYISATIEPGKIRLTLQGGGAISTGLQFRYILIPVNKLASGGLNYHDYDAVCNYYNIVK